MGYLALLFCPDDKTARTVTQVLTELEFEVVACTEPFAAVKKLMGEHFDAVVVDCDNEQNATLLFKSARNSTSNQTSLAVAVVEGQAGVAKAFRIGANLVLTKPINIEQSKGTLRVARGLLRKSEPGKAAAPAPASSSTPTSAAPLRPVTAVKPAAPVAPKPVAPVAAPQNVPAAPKPAPAWPTAAAAANTTPTIQDSKPPAVGPEKPAVPPQPTAPKIQRSATLPPVPKPHVPAVAASDFKPTLAATPITSGAASAPAPAREVELPKFEEKASAAADALFEKPAAAVEPAPYAGSTPTFGMSAAETAAQSSGGNKKIFLGAAAAMVVVAAGYFAWAHFNGKPGATSAPQTIAASAPAGSAPVSQPLSAPVAPTSTTATPSQNLISEKGTSSTNATTSEAGASHKPAASHSAKAFATEAPVESEPAVEVAPAPKAIVVKGGKAPATQPKAAQADAPAPSMIGMAAPGASAPPVLANSGSAFKPVLQTLNVSQGVSQGLLYKKVAPVYPQNAMRMHLEGTVQLMATISKTGDITRVKVVSGEEQLARAASEAVKQWKYKPYLLNGEPLEIQTQITVNFKLP